MAGELVPFRATREVAKATLESTLQQIKDRQTADSVRAAEAVALYQLVTRINGVAYAAEAAANHLSALDAKMRAPAGTRLGDAQSEVYDAAKTVSVARIYKYGS